MHRTERQELVFVKLAAGVAVSNGKGHFADLCPYSKATALTAFDFDFDKKLSIVRLSEFCSCSSCLTGASILSSSSSPQSINQSRQF